MTSRPGRLSHVISNETTPAKSYKTAERGTDGPLEGMSIETVLFPLFLNVVTIAIYSCESVANDKWQLGVGCIVVTDPWQLNVLEDVLECRVAVEQVG